MVHQPMHKSSSWNPPSQENSSQVAPRPLAVQAQQNSQTLPIQTEIEQDAYDQNKFEAFGIQIKQASGTNTSVEPKRLGALPAKMAGFWVQRQAGASRFNHTFAHIPVHAPDQPVSAPVQPTLAMQPDQAGVPPQFSQSAIASTPDGEMDLVQRALPARTIQSLPIPPIQTKLTIGSPHDPYEQEADRVASQVVNQIQPKSILQRRGAVDGGAASSDLESQIARARGGGQPLDLGLQVQMGQAMGADFSGVRVHTDAQADQMNQSIQAKAFTTGQDVFFRQGAYAPRNRGGQELIAHELTHVVQQNGGADVMEREDFSSKSTQKQSNIVSSVPSKSKFETIQRKYGDEKWKKTWEKDKETLLGRINQLKGQGVQELYGYYSQFIGTLGSAPKDDQSATIKNIMGCLTDMQAMHLPYDWYLEHQSDENFEQLCRTKASSASQHGRLWSKLNVRRSKKETEKTGGVFLESSVGGYILNGLLFGFGWGESPALGKIWDELSSAYVRGLTGVVEADVLEGIDPTSVLSTTEIKNLLTRIQENKVTKLVVKIYKMEKNRFVQTDQIDVDNRDTWDAITKVPSSEVRGSENPKLISDLPWKERQHMIDKTERMLDELENKLKATRADVENGEKILSVSESDR